MESLNMPDVKFRPIFPSPMGYANFGESNRELNKELIKDIEHNMKNSEGKDKTFKKNESSWQSVADMENLYPSFKTLKQQISEAAKPVIVHSGMDKKYSEELAVKNLWANVAFNAGGYATPHIHGAGETLWSGVYYPSGLNKEKNLDNFGADDFLKIGYFKGDGLLILIDPSKTSKGLVKKGVFDSEYYGAEISIIPRESLLVLFPVWILHMVTPLTHKTKRYSISFAINKD